MTPEDEELLAAFIGPNWEDHYRDSFAAIRERTGTPGSTFNWAAALAPFWLAYRRMLLLQVGSVILFWILLISGLVLLDDLITAGVSGDVMALEFVLVYALLGAIQGLAGDRLLYRRAGAAVERARARGGDEASIRAAVARRGGASPGGVVVVPLGFFVFVVLDPFHLFFHHHDHERAYLAAMKSDLRNLVTAEESYFFDFTTYTLRPEEPARVPGDTGRPMTYFTPSTGVTVTVGVLTANGWNATARHNLTDQICGIFVGDAPPPLQGAVEGEPKCRR